MNIIKLVGLLCIMAVQFSAVRAEEFSDQYPGRFQDGTRRIDNVAYFQVQHAVQYYRKVYERWPSNWAEVTSSGIFQIPLVGPGLQVIDPDDGQFDFGWDVAYTLSNGVPKVHSKLLGGTQVQTAVLPDTGTYREWFTSRTMQELDPNIERYIDGTSRMKTLAITGLVFEALNQFKKLNARYPQHLGELMDSGLAPVNRTSLNPLTAQPFTGNLLPNDIYYRLTSSDSYEFALIESNGRLPQFRFSY